MPCYRELLRYSFHRDPNTDLWGAISLAIFHFYVVGENNFKTQKKKQEPSQETATVMIYNTLKNTLKLPDIPVRRREEQQLRKICPLDATFPPPCLPAQSAIKNYSVCLRKEDALANKYKTRTAAHVSGGPREGRAQL